MARWILDISSVLIIGFSWVRIGRGRRRCKKMRQFLPYLKVRFWSKPPGNPLTSVVPLLHFCFLLSLQRTERQLKLFLMGPLGVWWPFFLSSQLVRIPDLIQAGYVFLLSNVGFFVGESGRPNQSSGSILRPETLVLLRPCGARDNPDQHRVFWGPSQ